MQIGPPAVRLIPVSIDGFESLLRGIAATPPTHPPARITVALCALSHDPKRLADIVSVECTPPPVLELRNGELVATFDEHTFNDPRVTAAYTALILARSAPGICIGIAESQRRRPRSVQHYAAAARARFLAHEANGVILVDESLAHEFDARFKLQAGELAFTLSDEHIDQANTFASASPPEVQPRLELSRRRLRFVSTDVETHYQRWHAYRAIPFARAAMIATLVAWTMALLWCRFSTQSFNHAGPWIIAGMVSSITCLAASFSSRYQHQTLAIASFVNLCNGLLILLIGFHLLKPPGPSTQGVIWCAYSGFVVLRLDFRQALATCLPFMLLHEALTLWHFADHPAWMVRGLLPTTTSFLIAMLVGVVLTRLSRESFRQECLSDLQQRTSEWHQAEIERLSREADQHRLALLGSELRRQVAARSRSLLQALASRDSSQVATGDIIEGRYQVVRSIGMGGMGRVYEVLRLADRQPMALKVLIGEATPPALARFAREAYISAELQHPNVVGALDVGITPGGALFVVMQLVRGPSLAAEKWRFGDWAWAIPILGFVADALVAMHARGVVHRDLKPENILLEDGRPLVTDFGIARIHDISYVSLTQTGDMIGTLPYMAPELFDGPRHVTAKVDMFSLGVIGFRMLTGCLPHVVPPIVARREGQPVVALALTDVRADVPPGLADLIEGCLAEDPAARPSAPSFALRMRALAKEMAITDRTSDVQIGCDE